MSLHDISMKWSVRAFQALDSEARGYLYKDEILDHIRASGTLTNHQLYSVVEFLNEKDQRDHISL